MANKFVYEISANTSGYTQAVEEGKEANKQFTNSIEGILKETGSLKKQLSQSRRSVQDLAFAYSTLSKERKASAEGKALFLELQREKEAAAGLLDTFKDVSEELNHMASDTASWDAMKQGIGIVKDGIQAAAVTLGDITGSEKEFKAVLETVAKAEAIANTAISIGNALQKNSAIITRIRTAQEKALKIAIEGEAAATGKATIAQRAFNIVAKANPYVLLATALVAVGAALYAFTKHNQKAKQAQEEEKKAAEAQKDALDAYKNKLSSTLSDSIVKYKTLQAQWEKLKTSHEKNQFIKNNKQQFDEYRKMLGKAASAEDILTKMSDEVVAGLQKRAKAAAYSAMAQVYYQKALEKTIELENRETEKAKRIQEELKKGDYNVTQTIGTASNGAVMTNTYLSKASDRIAKINEEYEEGNKALAKQRDELEAQADQLIVNSVQIDNTTNSFVSSTDKQRKAAVGSIAAIEAEISKLQEQAKMGLLPKELNDPEEFKRKIESLTSEAKELKIKWGFEKPEQQKTKLQELQKQLEDANLSYQLAVEANDEDARQAALKVVKDLEEQIRQHKIAISIEPEMTEQEKNKIHEKVNDIVNKALSEDVEVKYDFSLIPDNEKKNANKLLDQYKKLIDAKEELTNLMNDPDATDTQISDAQKALAFIIPLLEKYASELNVVAAANEELDKKQEKTKKTLEALGNVSDVIGSLGDAFSALGDAADDQGTKVAGIIASTIANLLSGYAQATAAAGGMLGPWGWAAFSLAGLAQVTAMVAQIKQLQQSAGSYADGGIIGGTSYYGDRLTASVNSGEMILNRSQQAQLFDIANGGLNGLEPLDNRPSGNKVEVVGVIRAKDILLVQKNYNSIMSKSGQSIKIS